MWRTGAADQALDAYFQQREVVLQRFEAATYAARRHPSLWWIVANADRRLPVLDASVDLVLSVLDRFGAIGGGPLSSSITLATFVSLFPLLLVVIAFVVPHLHLGIVTPLIRATPKQIKDYVLCIVAMQLVVQIIR